MPQYILDSIGNSAGVRTFGAMSITNLQFPTSVEPNTPFDIIYDAENTSANPQDAFGYIFDFGTQQQVPGSYWEVAVPSGQSHPVTTSFMGITQTFSGEVRVGHIEGGVEGCLEPTGAESGYVCGNPAFPNTPTAGHRYQCQSGTWVDLGIDQTNCPTGGGINPMFIMAAIAAVAVVGIVFIIIKK
jgi:hypothetical protein